MVIVYVNGQKVGKGEGQTLEEATHIAAQQGVMCICMNYKQK